MLSQHHRTEKLDKHETDKVAGSWAPTPNIPSVN